MIIYSKTYPKAQFYFISLIAIFAVLMVQSCKIDDSNSKDTIRIELSSDSINLATQNIVVERMTPSQNIAIDCKTEMKDGILSLEFDPFQSPDIYSLLFENQERINLIIYNNEVVKIALESEPISWNYKISGSYESQFIQDLNTIVYRCNSQMDFFYKQYRNAPIDSNRTNFRLYTDSILQQLQLQMYGELKDSIRSKSNSLAGLLGLYSKIGRNNIFDINLDFDLFQLVSDSLSSSFPDNTHAVFFKERMNSIINKNNIIEERAKQLDKGNIFPDICLNCLDENKYCISECTSEYKIIYLWKSNKAQFWQLNPILKTIYNKHSRKQVDIIAISFESDKLEWANYCRLERFNWINLISGPENEMEINPRSQYPKVYILDRENKILAVDPDTNDLHYFNDKLMVK